MAELKIYGSISSKEEGSNVTAESVKRFLDGLKPNEDLTVRINSFGGEVTNGLAIYNNIKKHKGTTHIYVDGAACSIASLIAFAGDKLYMPESSLLMIHLPYVGVIGNRIDLEKEIEALVTVEKVLLDVYKTNLNNVSDESAIEKFLLDEKWLDGKEAAQYFKIELINENGKSGEKSNSLLAQFKKGKPKQNNLGFMKVAAAKAKQAQSKKVGPVTPPDSLLENFKKGAKKNGKK